MKLVIKLIKKTQFYAFLLLYTKSMFYRVLISLKIVVMVS
jgi:hypothetical protein